MNNQGYKNMIGIHTNAQHQQAYTGNGKVVYHNLDDNVWECMFDTGTST